MTRWLMESDVEENERIRTMGAQLNEEAWKRIILDNAMQIPVEETAEQLGITRFAVSTSIRMILSVKNENWDNVKALLRSNQSQSCMKWAAELYKKQLPEDVLQVAADATEKQTNSRKKSDGSKPENSEDIKLFMQTVIAEQKKTNELLEQLFDVVIPKWTSDIKDNVNVNSDLQNQTLKRIEDKLEGIKINTRKRGL